MYLKVVILLFLLLCYCFQRSFELKRGKYLVIGNCANCWPRDIKQTVKNFDGTVILFNNNKHFETLNTNIIVLCNSARKRKLLTKKLTAFPLVFVDAYNDLFSSSLLNGLYTMLYCLFHRKPVFFMKLNSCNVRGNRPTTGLMVVEKLVSIGSEIYITGFDPRDQSIHGPNDSRHNFHTERKILNDWKSNNIIAEL